MPAAFGRLGKAGAEERDDTCAPEGTTGRWEVIARNPMTDEDRRYQRQITRTPPLPGNLMLEYRVTNTATSRTAMFDGCAYWSPSHELLEAKNWSGWMSGVKPEHQTGLAAYDQLADEAGRQEAAVGRTHPVEWHVSNESALGFVRRAMQDGMNGASNFSAHHTPLQ